MYFLYLGSSGVHLNLESSEKIWELLSYSLKSFACNLVSPGSGDLAFNLQLLSSCHSGQSLISLSFGFVVGEKRVYTSCRTLETNCDVKKLPRRMLDTYRVFNIC